MIRMQMIDDFFVVLKKFCFEFWQPIAFFVYRNKTEVFFRRKFIKSNRGAAFRAEKYLHIQQRVFCFKSIVTDGTFKFLLWSIAHTVCGLCR